MQGVCFRASTQQQAEHYRINGSVRNLSDGSVEVIACGEETDLNALREWLRQGPEYAQVDKVQCESLMLELTNGFTID